MTKRRYYIRDLQTQDPLLSPPSQSSILSEAYAQQSWAMRHKGQGISLIRCNKIRQFTNVLMKGGGRANASKILLDSIKICKSKIFEKNIKESNSFALESRRPDSLTGQNTQSASTYRPPHRLKVAHCKKQSDRVCTNAVYNVEPIVETRKVRVRGSTYQVPSISHARRRRRVAIHWMLAAAKSKKRSSQRLFFACLGQELFDSSNNEGSSVLRRDQMHKLAAHSRAYARYRWW